MAHSFASLYYHIVFSTKDRRPFITPELRPRLAAYMGGILRQHRGALLDLNGTADHTHLLGSLHRDMAVSEAVRLVKANTTNWIHATFPELQQFAWQEGYGAFSLSYAGLDRVKAYFAGQEEHHRRVTFPEEFIGFLKQHQISYDERYIWE